MNHQIKYKKDLDVFTWGYLKGFRHLFYNVKNFFLNIKYAWQRATLGYCDRDLWNLDWYYTFLLRNSLQEFADRHSGYPAIGFENDKQWTKYLEDMAELFDKSSIYSDEHYKNPYTEKYYKQLEERLGVFINEKIITEEDKRISKAYWKEEKKISNKKYKDRKFAFRMLLGQFDNLWD